MVFVDLQRTHPFGSRDSRRVVADLNAMMAFFRVHAEIRSIAQHAGVRRPHYDRNTLNRLTVHHPSFLQTANQVEIQTRNETMICVANLDYDGASNRLQSMAERTQRDLDRISMLAQMRDDRNFELLTGISPGVATFFSVGFTALECIPCPVIRAVGVAGNGAMTSLITYGSRGGRSDYAATEAVVAGTLDVSANLCFGLGTADDVARATQRMSMLLGFGCRAAQGFVPALIGGDDLRTAVEAAATNVISQAGGMAAGSTTESFTSNLGTRVISQTSDLDVAMVNLASAVPTFGATQGISSLGPSTIPGPASDVAVLSQAPSVRPAEVTQVLIAVTSSLGVNERCRPQVFVERYLLRQD